ncbi:MAG: serine/threonine-protein kinase, partial [Planctomycetota bacterium]
MAGSRNPRIPEWSSGGRRESNRRPATGRLPRRTTATTNPDLDQPVHSSFIPDEFKTEEDLPFVPSEGPSQGGQPSASLQTARSGTPTEIHLPAYQDPAAIAAADTGPGGAQLFAGKYELLEKVGEGGMGSVYKAHNRLLNVEVALKVLTPDKITSPDVRERFLREARATQMFRHRHAIAVQEVGELTDGTVYLTMDFSSGENLEARIKRLGRLSLDEAVLITLQVLDALTEAHRTGIVHRDLKPGNIMVEFNDGRPFAMVVDFGIAKILQDTGIMSRQSAPLTSPGMILGTVEYMSPEQAGGAVVDARSDIYSMGAVLYHMLTGQLPSPSDAVQTMIINIMFQPPKPIREIVTDGTIPQEVETVVMKALAKAVEDRYQSAHEFGAALRLASADYLPDDTRTQSSSFRLPTQVAQIHDPNMMPTMLFAAPPLESTEAAGGATLGGAQKAVLALAGVLLLAVVGLFLYKQYHSSGGTPGKNFGDRCAELEHNGEWETLHDLAVEAANRPADAAEAAHYKEVAEAEIELRNARTLGRSDTATYLGHLDDLEKQLTTTPGGADSAALSQRFGPAIQAARALLEGIQDLNAAQDAYNKLRFDQAAATLQTAQALFAAAKEPPPAQFLNLQAQCRDEQSLEAARQAANQARTDEFAAPPQNAAADGAWQNMIDELHTALADAAARPTDGIFAEDRKIYHDLLQQYLNSTRQRGLQLLPPGPAGSLSAEAAADLPTALDRWHGFFEARMTPLLASVKIGDGGTVTPGVPGAPVPSGATGASVPAGTAAPGANARTSAAATTTTTT